jgi:hypothetical protein
MRRRRRGAERHRPLALRLRVVAFLVYFFSKNLSATLAFVSLGDIATRKDQNGAYISLQAGF